MKKEQEMPEKQQKSDTAFQHQKVIEELKDLFRQYESSEITQDNFLKCVKIGIINIEKDLSLLQKEYEKEKEEIFKDIDKFGRAYLTSEQIDFIIKQLKQKHSPKDKK